MDLSLSLSVTFMPMDDYSKRLFKLYRTLVVRFFGLRCSCFIPLVPGAEQYNTSVRWRWIKLYKGDTPDGI